VSSSTSKIVNKFTATGPYNRLPAISYSHYSVYARWCTNTSCPLITH